MKEKTIWSINVQNLASRKFLVTLLFMFAVTVCFLIMLKLNHNLAVDYWIAYIGAMEAALGIYGTHEVIEKYNKGKTDALKNNGVNSADNQILKS